MRKNCWLLIFIGAMIAGWLTTDVFGEVVIKVRALNPLETTETAVIEYPLPKEITEEDILKRKITYSLDHSEDEDPPKSEFKISYDEEAGGYFIDDEVVLLPKEVVTLSVHVKDIWVIKKEQIEELRQEVDGLLVEWEMQLKDSTETKSDEEKSKDEETKQFALMMKEEILGALDKIIERQEKNSIIAVGVERHMEAFSENIKDLRQIEQDIVLMTNLIQYESGSSDELAPIEDVPETETEELGNTAMPESTDNMNVEEETTNIDKEHLTDEKSTLEPTPNLALEDDG